MGGAVGLCTRPTRWSFANLKIILVDVFDLTGGTMPTSKELLERLAIREIVENWALLRDARRWDRFREIWHEEGRMITTWIEGSFD